MVLQTPEGGDRRGEKSYVIKQVVDEITTPQARQALRETIQAVMSDILPNIQVDLNIAEDVGVNFTPIGPNELDRMTSASQLAQFSEFIMRQSGQKARLLAIMNRLTSPIVGGRTTIVSPNAWLPGAAPLPDGAKLSSVVPGFPIEMFIRPDDVRYISWLAEAVGYRPRSGRSYLPPGAPVIRQREEITPGSRWVREKRKIVSYDDVAYLLDKDFPEKALLALIPFSGDENSDDEVNAWWAQVQATKELYRDVRQHADVLKVLKDRALTRLPLALAMSTAAIFPELVENANTIADTYGLLMAQSGEVKTNMAYVLSLLLEARNGIGSQSAALQSEITNWTTMWNDFSTGNLNPAAYKHFIENETRVDDALAGLLHARGIETQAPQLLKMLAGIQMRHMSTLIAAQNDIHGARRAVTGGMLAMQLNLLPVTHVMTHVTQLYSLYMSKVMQTGSDRLLNEELAALRDSWRRLPYSVYDAVDAAGQSEQTSAEEIVEIAQITNIDADDDQLKSPLTE